MRDLLTMLAEETGETLWVVDETRLSTADRAPAQGGAGIAVVPLQGVLMPRSVSFFGRVIFPGLDAFRASLAQAAASPDVAAIVLDVNSPGGAYASTPETANAVRAAAQQKPVIAMVDTLCASGAYLIASQATEVVVTPSGELGSIGAMIIHADMSKALENEGVDVSIIRSRPSKASTTPYEPLSDEARAWAQASVDEADAEFLKAVAKGRNMSAAQVRKMVDENGLGRTVSAGKAVELGLADRVATMGEVLSGMIKPRQTAAAAKRRSSLAFD
jgi:signal peptide peptidase SppA